ncbi:MAG: 2'-5' RNA ligase family protein [Lachnospiraceae bacterium]|nr:2'-5' RNA ligase family protein [Lachnospiraceae bacterium]
MEEQFLTLMANLDDESQERLSRWYHILQQEGFMGTQTPGLSYHISLSNFPLDQEEKAVEIAQRVSAEFAPVSVHFSHLGLFVSGKILFAAPEKDSALIALHEACKSDTPQQHPWTPHTTILIDEPNVVYRALPFVIKEFVPFVAKITRLHLCAFWPTREIVTCELTG